MGSYRVITDHKLPEIRRRHAFMASSFPSLCVRCARIKGARVHRLGTRCSVCFRYFKHFEVDDFRRCDGCRLAASCRGPKRRQELVLTSPHFRSHRRTAGWALGRGRPSQAVSA